MRRSLVITDEAARHPFLVSLPPHVRRVDKEQTAGERNWRLVSPITADDVRGFMSAYCACLLAAVAFLF